mmetsp:Transcript_76348/g.149598  ORF Transcript_76348/g.149598 Transcript_76348/m.149598 type:complete len:343 (+) Transcript_76348:238-1266(+)
MPPRPFVSLWRVNCLRCAFAIASATFTSKPPRPATAPLPSEGKSPNKRKRSPPPVPLNEEAPSSSSSSSSSVGKQGAVNFSGSNDHRPQEPQQRLLSLLLSLLRRQSTSKVLVVATSNAPATALAAVGALRYSSSPPSSSSSSSSNSNSNSNSSQAELASSFSAGKTSAKRGLTDPSGFPAAAAFGGGGGVDGFTHSIRVPGLSKREVAAALTTHAQLVVPKGDRGGDEEGAESGGGGGTSPSWEAHSDLVDELFGHETPVADLSALLRVAAVASTEYSALPSMAVSASPTFLDAFAHNKEPPQKLFSVTPDALRCAKTSSARFSAPPPAKATKMDLEKFIL